LIDEVFAASADSTGMPCVKQWYGRTIYNTDGTFFQMQDAPEIPQKYRVQKNADGTTQGYPQGLLQVLTQHGTGFMSSYRIAGRNQSELDVFCTMIQHIPTKSLLLADDFYNCYALFSLLRDHHIDVIVPDKKDRNYRVVKQIAPGDEIIEIVPHTKVRSLMPDQQMPKKLLLRRITYRDLEHPEDQRILLTTILDESIERVEFIHQYTTRWDVEITIREIKTLMGINIARAKSEEMVYREIAVALLAYNLVRKIVAQSASQTPFSPQTDFFEKLHSTYSNTLVDRKGRVYSRWSPGRPPAHHYQAQRSCDTPTTRKTLPASNKSRSISKIQ